MTIADCGAFWCVACVEAGWQVVPRRASAESSPSSSTTSEIVRNGAKVKAARWSSRPGGAMLSARWLAVRGNNGWFVVPHGAAVAGDGIQEPGERGLGDVEEDEPICCRMAAAA